MKYIATIFLFMLSIHSFGQSGKIVITPFQEGECFLRYGLPNHISIEGILANFDSIVLECKYGKLRKRSGDYIYFIDPYAKDSVKYESFYLYKVQGSNRTLIDSTISCIDQTEKFKINLQGVIGDIVNDFDTLKSIPRPQLIIPVTCINITSFRVMHYRGDKIMGSYSVKYHGNEGLSLESIHTLIMEDMRDGDRLIYYDIRIEGRPHGIPVEVWISRSEN